MTAKELYVTESAGYVGKPDVSALIIRRRKKTLHTRNGRLPKEMAKLLKPALGCFSLTKKAWIRMRTTTSYWTK
jgi:hypothetical protein